MKTELEQTYELDDENSTKFCPFRLRKSYWSNSSDHIMIPNVATVIPPDVHPDLLPILLYRMKLEEIAYKAKNLDTQAQNTAFLENKLDLYLFPDLDDALLSKAYESLRFEKHNIIKEIDKALPPVLPPPIILPDNIDLPAVRAIKRPFNVSQSQNQDTAVQNQSEEYEYSEGAQPQLDDKDEQEKGQENENFDSNYENEYYSQQQSSKKLFENTKDYSNLSQFENPPNSFSPYSQSYDTKLQNTPQFDESHQTPQSRNHMDNMYGNTHPQQKQQQSSQSPLQYQEPYNSASPYSHSSYRYGQPNLDDYNSPQKQHQIPPPPPYIHNYDRNQLNKIPPPPFISQSKQPQYPPPMTQQSRGFGPLPPPLPITQQQRPSQQPRDFGPLPPPPPPITQQQRTTQQSRDFPNLPPSITPQSRDFGLLPPPPPITQQQHLPQRSRDFSNLPPPPPISQQRNYVPLPIPPPPPLFINDKQQNNSNEPDNEKQVGKQWNQYDDY